MDIVMVNEDWEREEVKRVLDGHAAMVNTEMPADDWRDEHEYPRKVWIFMEPTESLVCGNMNFVVVDNREGECYVEDFETLDGAMLYACDVHLTCEDQESWDYPGAVKDRGSLNRGDE